MSDNKEKMGAIEFTFWPSGENPYERYTCVRYDIPTDCSIGELHDCCKKFMLALGFSEKTVEEYFGETVWDI